MKFTIAGNLVNDKIKKSIPVITFHKVDPSFEWGVTRVTPRQFRKIVKNIKDHGYESINLSEVFQNRENIPDKPVVFTFDDAYESVYEYAVPVLKESGFSAVFFVITDFVGKENLWDVNLGGLHFKHMTWSQIREVQKSGFEIGSHTVSHADLTRLDKRRVKREIFESKDKLQQNIGTEIKYISFPFGRYNDCVIDLCREAGYMGACSYWVHKEDAGKNFVIPRRAWYLFDPWFMIDSKLGNGFAGKIEEIKLRSINFFSHGTALLKPAVKN